MSRIVVTGGAGFLGVPTVRKLASAGHEIVVVDNFSTTSPSRLDELSSYGGMTIENADIRDADAIHRVFAATRPWGIIHLAAIHFIPYCVARPVEALEVNIIGVQNVLRAAADVGAARLVFTSTADVYRPATEPHCEEDAVDPINVYGGSKSAAEQLIKFWRIEGARTEPIVARVFNLIGPGETNPHVLPEILSQLRAGNALSLGNLHAKRDYVYVEDAADAVIGLLESDLADVTVNVGTGQSWSVSDLIERISALTGRELVVSTDPARMRASDRPNLCADPTRLRQLLPNATRTSIDQSLRKTLASAGLGGPV